jgi:hypothetical protein
MTISERVGRFSTGQEQIDATSEHTRVGRFSDGQETLHDGEDRILMGRFSTGQERLAETPERVRVGSYGDREHARRSLALHRQAEAVERLEVETVSS